MWNKIGSPAQAIRSALGTDRADVALSNNDAENLSVEDAIKRQNEIQDVSNSALAFIRYQLKENQTVAPGTILATSCVDFLKTTSLREKTLASIKKKVLADIPAEAGQLHLKWEPLATQDGKRVLQRLTVHRKSHKL